MPSPQAVCPFCARTVGTNGRRYTMHALVAGGDNYCPLSHQPLPATGYNPHDYERRAGTVALLAAQLRDEDPQGVYDYLRAQTHSELLVLCAVALAAINTDLKLSELYRWVMDLPAARFA